MARTRKLYVNHVIYKEYLSNETIDCQRVIENSIFIPISDSFTKIKDSASTVELEKIQLQYAGYYIQISDIRLQEGILYGTIGKFTDKVDPQLKEVDKMTLSSYELKPSSDKNIFSKQSYFAFSSQKCTLYYSREQEIPGNLPCHICRGINKLLAQIGSEYYLETTRLLETDIAEKIKELKGDVIVKGYTKSDKKNLENALPSLYKASNIVGNFKDVKVKFAMQLKEAATKQEIENYMEAIEAEEMNLERLEATGKGDQAEVIDLITRTITKSININPSDDELASLEKMIPVLRNAIFSPHTSNE